MSKQEIVQNSSSSQNVEQVINIEENLNVQINELYKKEAITDLEFNSNSQCPTGDQEQLIDGEKQCDKQKVSSQQQGNQINVEGACNQKKPMGNSNNLTIQETMASQQQQQAIYDNFNNYQKQFQNLQSESGSRIKPIQPNNNKFNQNQQPKRNDMELESSQDNDEAESEQLRQKQLFKCIDKQILQEIQYYVYQDLANVLGILKDTSQTLLHFSGYENSDYVRIALNKLILQINLSNGIHYDCQFNFQTQLQKEIYNLEKQKAKQLFIEILQKLQIPCNEVVQNCINQYITNLNPNTELKQMNSLQMNQRGQFNQKAVQTIFDGMRSVDEAQQQIKQGVYKKPEKQDIEQMLSYREERAKFQLQKNFPLPENQHQKQNQYQDWN